jgi:superfamily II DNA/RNA helicase
VGGTYIGVQIKTLRQKNEFIIGTPGRLVDLIDRAKIVLKEFDTIVLDEADRMLDMGFIADMKMIMAGMPADHQTLLFSATMSKEVEKIVREFLVEPTQISVKTEETAKNIDQDVVHVRRGENKIEILADLLKSPEFDKVLVFTRTKSGAQRLSEALYHMKFTAEAIHGDKTQYMRQKALRMFKEGKVQILVATDVAARGLDISNVSHVINFDVPATYDDYVHRIGRTGRGGKTGKALTFVE